jgi:hypothetical protein
MWNYIPETKTFIQHKQRSHIWLHVKAEIGHSKTTAQTCSVATDGARLPSQGTTDEGYHLP